MNYNTAKKKNLDAQGEEGMEEERRLGEELL